MCENTTVFAEGFLDPGIGRLFSHTATANAKVDNGPEDRHLTAQYTSSYWQHSSHKAELDQSLSAIIQLCFIF